MQIFKNKYMMNLLILVVFLFFVGEGLESFAEGKQALAIIEFAASVAAVALVIAKRRKDKNEHSENEEE